MSDRVVVDYYTDILCVWAYFAQVKIDELKQEFADQVEIRHHYLSLFGNNQVRIAEGWTDGVGGFAGYAAHVQELGKNFPHVALHPDLWLANAPASSMPIHLYLKAVQLLEQRGSLEAAETQHRRSASEQLAWRLRLAFFRDAKNIGQRAVLDAEATAIGIPTAALDAVMQNGEAHAALSLDMDERSDKMIEGSPTFLMNEGRQKLYGNIGYRAIAANVQENLERKVDVPSWC